jgi:hypothetical protein
MKSKAVYNYIKEKHTQDECSGFIDGYEKCEEDMADKKYTEEDMCAFIEFTRNNYTGFGAPHLVYNKGRQEKTKQIFERFINSLNKQD